MGERSIRSEPTGGEAAGTRTESERALVARAVAGRSTAISRLFARLRTPLERWAHGRLPRWARARLDTADLVQEAFLRLLPRLPGFEPRHAGALGAYLREAIRNRIRDEVRRAGKVEVPATTGLAEPRTSGAQLRGAIDGENRRRYLAALARLSAADRDLVVGRLDLDYSYEQLALACGKATPEAARVGVRRALLRLAEEIDAV